MKIADDIISAVCAEHGISVEQLMQSGMRTQGVSAARRSAVNRLWDAHFSAKWIAARLQITIQAAHYHIYPAARGREKRSRDKMLERTRAARAEMRA
jgi:hypothetical protein